MRFDVAADGAEVAILHGAVDIDDAADVVLRDDLHLGGALDGGEIAEDLRLAGRPSRGWGCFEIAERLHGIAALRDEIVVHAVLLVEEEHRRDLHAAAQGVEHVVGDILLVNPPCKALVRSTAMSKVG
jgi:hypothetical protein